MIVNNPKEIYKWISITLHIFAGVLINIEYSMTSTSFLFKFELKPIDRYRIL